MSTAAEVLLIIVSSVLSVFLILSAIAIIYLIRTLKRINDMADTVENTADAIRNTATAIPLIKFAMRFMNRNRKRR